MPNGVPASGWLCAMGADVCDLDHASQRSFHGVDQRITFGTRVPCETELDVRQGGQGVRVVAGHGRFEVNGHERRHAEPGPQPGEHTGEAVALERYPPAPI